ncbi:MAG: PTS sugar transporter subunit IIB [Breznakia sp.]
MSNIVGARVDERLIHGQVATAWTNHLKATRIMVIDNDLVVSSIDKMALKMACPSNCKLSILSVEKAIKNLKTDKYEKDRIFIVCKKPDYFATLLENNVNFDKVILGNMSDKGNTSKMLRRSVYVNQEDIVQLDKIKSFGTMIYLQQTPSDTGEIY